MSLTRVKITMVRQTMIQRCLIPYGLTLMTIKMSRRIPKVFLRASLLDFYKNVTTTRLSHIGRIRQFLKDATGMNNYVLKLIGCSFRMGRPSITALPLSLQRQKSRHRLSSYNFQSAQGVSWNIASQI